MSDDQSNDHQMSTSEEMFPVVNRGLFDAVVALNAANGVKAAELKRVLLDLIAELRRSAKGYLSPGAYAITVKEQLWLADWAEARLREVQ